MISPSSSRPASPGEPYPRGNSRGGKRQQMAVKIIATAVPVRDQPLRNGTILCRLQKNFIVVVVEEAVVDGIPWLRLNSGWLCTKDSNGVVCYVQSTDMEANKFWMNEYDNRRRLSSAICQMLTKSCSLPNARKIVSILHNRANQSHRVGAPALDLPHVTTEDLLIGIASAAGKGLNSTEIFEIMKAAASKQSDPVKALVGIAEDLHKLMNLRPTLWVKQDLSILDTETLMVKNNQFVMAAARNDVAKIEHCLALGQDLTVLHSEMKYTALHAAADFGSADTLVTILKTGIPPNIRDARFGQTALHFAAQSGRTAMITILLEYGADRMIPDLKGVLPFEVAAEHGYAVCREMLKEPPPPVMLASVVSCSSSSITITWQAPATIKSQHAMVEEYMVVHQDVTISKCQGEGTADDDPNADHNWNPAKGYQHEEGIDMLYTWETRMTVSNLNPSTGHGFLLLSRSAAGWSKPSAKLVHFTLPDVPTEPSKVELLKVNKNGLVVAWHPPYLDNGCKITLYELELTDKEPVIDETEAEGDEESVQVSLAQSEENSLAENSLADTSLASSIATKSHGQKELRDSDGGWHRLVKHRQVDRLEKYLMGLEFQRKYYFRCRCRNEVGWSCWGDFSGPYMPQEGARVVEFGDMWLRLQWVAPVLKNRTVTAYEVQMCEPSGPRQNSLTVFSKRKDSKASQAEEKSEEIVDQIDTGGYQFYTVDDAVKENQTVIRNLRPGIRYQFRVRPQIDGVWSNANLIQMSDIIAIPASAPESPTDVRVCMLTPTIYRRPTTGATVSSGMDTISENAPSRTADISTLEESDPVMTMHYNEDMQLPAVAHDSILIAWSNGNPNGSPIIESAIEMARVREYDHEDTVLGLESSGKLMSGQFTNNKLSLSAGFGDNDVMSENTEMDIKSALNWTDVTQNGKYVSSTSFRVTGLLPGCGYIFRIRQRNGVGWSGWSLASEMAITLAAAPPRAPMVTHAGSFNAVVEWADTNEEFNYTILDYELQVALLPPGKQVHSGNTDHDDTTWDVQLEWTVPETRRHDNSKHPMQSGPTSAVAGSVDGNSSSGAVFTDNFDCRSVFVDKLSPMSVYVARVKVRTVTGWSAWSGIGKPFRTLSPP